MIKVKLQKIGDMKKRDIDGEYKTTTITHFDGNTRKLFYTEKETLLADGETITSSTDPMGNITLANSAFMRLSGYTQKELIGAPHYALHHPDMPKVVFAQMWAELRANGKWQGYVKNLRKDGGFYWVFASIFSNKRNGELVGYTSARVAAPRDQVAIFSQRYANLLTKEHFN